MKAFRQDPKWSSKDLTSATQRVLAEIDDGSGAYKRSHLRAPARNDLTCIERSSNWTGIQLSRSSTSPAEIRLQQRAPEAPGEDGAASSTAGTRLGNSAAALDASFVRRGNFWQKGFSITNRPPIYAKIDSEVGPGAYDTHAVGSLVWAKENVSHPSQKQLSQHKCFGIVTFGKPKTTVNLGPSTSTPALVRSPGPGHYLLPDLWDPTWQNYPPKGISFVRQPPVAGESRFGGLARGLGKGAKGEMNFLSR